MSYASVEEIVRDLEEHPVERSGHVYHAIPFPEFSHLSSSADAQTATRKLEVVASIVRRRRELGLPWARVLDIGANAGLFTFSLASEVRSVTAYEPHPRYGPIGEFLARSRTGNVDWRARPFDLSEVQRSWDIALMLSTFQWITDGDKDLARGQELLEALSQAVPCLIFELGLNSGKSTVTTTRKNHIAVIYRLLRASTDYPHIKLVARARPWGDGSSRRGWRYTFVCSNDDGSLREKWPALLKHISV